MPTHVDLPRHSTVARRRIDSDARADNDRKKRKQSSGGYPIGGQEEAGNRDARGRSAQRSCQTRRACSIVIGNSGEIVCALLQMDILNTQRHNADLKDTMDALEEELDERVGAIDQLEQESRKGEGAIDKQTRELDALNRQYQQLTENMEVGAAVLESAIDLLM